MGREKGKRREETEWAREASCWLHAGSMEPNEFGKSFLILIC